MAAQIAIRRDNEDSERLHFDSATTVSPNTNGKRSADDESDDVTSPKEDSPKSMYANLILFI